MCRDIDVLLQVVGVHKVYKFCGVQVTRVDTVHMHIKVTKNQQVTSRQDESLKESIHLHHEVLKRDVVRRGWGQAVDNNDAD